MSPVGDTQIRRPHLSRNLITIIAIAAVAMILLGVYTIVALRRSTTSPDVEMVEVTNAIAWATSIARESAASSVTITLKTPSCRPYADAEVIIDEWTDDRGTDLLMPVLRTSYGIGGYQWTTQVAAAKGGFGTSPAAVIVPAIGSSTPTQISWTAGSPVDVSPVATAMRVKGRVVLHEGKDRESVRVEASDTLPGKSFRIGQTECRVVGEYHDKHADGRMIVLWSSDCRTPLAAVRFVDNKERDVWIPDPHWTFQERSEKILWRIDRPLLRSDGIVCPPVADYAAMIVEYWSGTRTRNIPFDVTLPLTRQTALSISDLLPVPSRVVGSRAPDPLYKPVPEAAWGALADDDPRELCEVTCDPDIAVYNSDRFWSRFIIRFKKPVEMTTYDITLTGIRDSEGNSLLCCRPARSALGQYSELETLRYSYWRKPGDQFSDVGPFFNLKVSRWPSSKATSVEVEGVLKFKIADTLETVELAGVSADGKTSYTVGPVRLRLCAERNNTLAIDSEGDQGLIQEFTFLGHDGTVFDTMRRASPFVFWSQNMRFGFELDADKIKALAKMQVKYYSHYRHYVLPFKVTVPLRKED